MKDKKLEKPDDLELAATRVYPHGLSATEKAAADAEMRRLRMIRLGKTSENQRLYAEILRLKYQIEDYLKYGKYEDRYSFGAFLRKYLTILDRKQKDFAQEINLHPTKLNQILNDRLDVNVALVYRLEKHSGGLITATDWWNLHAKKIEAGILFDRAAREAEGKNVKRALVFG